METPGPPLDESSASDPSSSSSSSEPLEPFLLAGDPDLEDEVHHSDPKGELYLRPFSRVYLAEKWDVLAVPNLVVYHLPSRKILTQHARFDLLKDNKIESTWAKWSEGEKIDFGVAGQSVPCPSSSSARKWSPRAQSQADRIKGVCARRSGLRSPVVDRSRRSRLDVRHQRPLRRHPRRHLAVDRQLLKDVSLWCHRYPAMRRGTPSRTQRGVIVVECCSREDPQGCIDSVSLFKRTARRDSPSSQSRLLSSSKMTLSPDSNARSRRKCDQWGGSDRQRFATEKAMQRMGREQIRRNDVKSRAGDTGTASTRRCKQKKRGERDGKDGNASKRCGGCVNGA